MQELLPVGRRHRLPTAQTNAGLRSANLHEVLSYIQQATPTEIRAIINTVNALPSWLRTGKEVGRG